MTFTELGLSESVLRAVSEAGYETPTPIQKQAIPQVLMGRDVLGCAQTGTGKTASFTLPMIDILGQGRAKARMPRSLILEPTRELAAQVEENFETYGKHTKLTTALLIGGVSFTDQFKKLDRGADVLIATPGRLLDHVERGKVLMNDVSFLVIDEADRMLDMGFIPDVERIVSFITKKHQTLLFSATMPKEIRRLADRFLKEPKEITVAAPSSVADTVEQALLIVQHRDKRAALRALLRSQDVQNGLIFCNRKRDVGVVHRSLVRHGFDAGALHGDMDQFQRTDTLDKFKANEIKLLVCSDVAARGLDIAAVSHVFNFDVPTHAEDYVHRIGRTGRAGRSGKAYTLAAPEDSKYIAGIERLAGKEIPRVEIEEFAGAALKEEAAKSRRGRKSEKAPVEKTEKKARKQDEKPARKDKQGKRGDRRNRDGIGDVPDYGDVPFGETDLVPAFLKRTATL
jgi:superfamily II DNA/RNA helicase